jgi:peptidoglycan/LPS O-acetylase OafA/YrhL
MTDIKIEKNYMPGLDGLRALAVFAVIAFHLNLPFLPGGFLGVTLFFVLSGYLITDLLLNEWTRRNTIDFKGFFVRRGKRLLPSVFFLLLCLTAYVTILQPALVSSLKSDILPAAFSFSNWWYIFQKIPYFQSFASPSLFNHFWSLAVEVQFYLVWPFMFYLLQRFINKKWLKIGITALIAILSAVLMAVLYEPGGDPSRIYYGTDTRIFSLLIGACLAFLLPSFKLAELTRRKSLRRIFDIIGLAALLAILFMTIYITQYDDFLYYGGMVVFSLVSVLLIGAAASPLTITGKVFGALPLRFIGKISYGVYLWHFPIIVITNSLFPSSSINVLLCVLQVASSILLATVSYYLIEMPIRRKKIIESLKKSSFKEFCATCVHSNWQIKTAALLVFALVLTSGLGLIKAQALPSTDTGDVSSISSPNPGLPPEHTGEPPSVSPSQGAAEPDISPSPDLTPSPDVSPSTDSPPSPDVSPSDSPAVVSPDPHETPGVSPEPPEESTEPEIIPSGLCITVIGDSVGIDMEPYLKKYYPNMDIHAEVGRQFYQAKTIIKELLQKNKLSSTVVIELGSNGSFSDSQMRALIEQIGSHRKIVFINTQVPRSWCAGVNEALSRISAEYPNTIVADWYTASLDKSEYFYKDGFHPNSVGSPVLAKLVAEAIDEIHPYKPYMPIG